MEHRLRQRQASPCPAEHRFGLPGGLFQDVQIFARFQGGYQAPGVQLEGHITDVQSAGALRYTADGPARLASGRRDQSPHPPGEISLLTRPAWEQMLHHLALSDKEACHMELSAVAYVDVDVGGASAPAMTGLGLAEGRRIVLEAPPGTLGACRTRSGRTMRGGNTPDGRTNSPVAVGRGRGQVTPVPSDAEGNRADEPGVTAPRSVGQDCSIPPDSWRGTLRWGVRMGDTGWA